MSRVRRSPPDHLTESCADDESDDGSESGKRRWKQIHARIRGVSSSGYRTPPRIRAVQSWNVKEIEVPEGARRAAALETVDGARAIIIRLTPGEELGEHQVRERAWLMVVDGSARIEAGGDVVEAGAGTLLTFEPDERHKVSSVSGTRIVMILSSWPADGHYPSWPGDVLPST
jgi:quercetin dioxygenase-like cupin family protein